MWRAAGDRVVVRRVGTGEAAELVGVAALVWVAADEPATDTQLALTIGTGPSDLEAAIELLTSSGWLTDLGSGSDP